HDERIRLITNDIRTGLVSQRNRAVAEARSDVIAIMDADDIADQYRIEKQLQFLVENPTIDVVGSNLRIIGAKNETIGYRKYPTTHDEILATMPKYNAIAHPSVMVRKNALIAVGGYEEHSPAEDYDLWSRMLMAGYRFHNLVDPLLNYRVHPNSLSKGKRIRNTILQTRIIKKKYWWHRMSCTDRFRFYGESLISIMPPEFILQLFQLMTYGNHL
ncbi:MAG: glycosyltransferase, partial [Gemmata sp.]|nr:glycosyltransferase [Gemmata sp.]